MKSHCTVAAAAFAALILCLAAGAQAQFSKDPGPNGYAIATYKAVLHAVYHGPAKPTGTAFIQVWNETYAEVSFSVKRLVGATMAHIHNGTLPNSPGGIVQWAFQSSLPGVAALNPINAATLSGLVPFDPTATGVIELLLNNRAYFNFHSVAYPNGVLQGNFV